MTAAQQQVQRVEGSYSAIEVDYDFLYDAHLLFLPGLILRDVKLNSIFVARAPTASGIAYPLE